jgi:hypothetical protein
MHLPALTVGYAVPSADFDAAIHSVFRTAANLRPTKGDLLLTLVASGEADLPQGIRVDTPEGFSFEKLRAGSRIVCRDKILDVENSSLTIELRGAKLWECDLPAIQADITNPAVVSTWKTVWQMLNKRQKRLGADIVAEALFSSDETAQSVVSRQAGQGLRDLVSATQHYDPDINSILSMLIGLGTGLTPSGDDLLVGYLTGLWCTLRKKTDRRRFATKLGRTIIDLSQGTNDISRTYLYHAAQGQVTNHLVTLAQAISQGEASKRLLDIAETAMQAGHTSGMDSVTGLLLGLMAWSHPGTSELLSI